jgi:hypothetical protein
MPEPVQNALRRCWDPAALYVRARADRVAVKDQSCRLFEAKTNSGRYTRASIEALPITHYIRLGVPCLYVYRDVKDGFEAAFWTTAVPAIDVIFLPDRWTTPMKRFFRNQFQELWPETDIVEVPAVNGSNDPYVVMSRDSLAANALDWRTVFVDPPEKPLVAEARPVGKPVTADEIRW